MEGNFHHTNQSLFYVPSGITSHYSFMRRQKACAGEMEWGLLTAA